MSRSSQSCARLRRKNGQAKKCDERGFLRHRPKDEYFGRETSKMVIHQPFVLLEQMGKLDFIVNVVGGGLSGQAGAIRHGLSRALLLLNLEYRPALKKAGFLTRDPRAVERKKYGQPGARRRFQFSKR